MFISFVAGLGIWIFGIRPYLMQRGVTVITAANWGVSAWSDWQQCRESTRVAFVAGLIAMLCGF